MNNSFEVSITADAFSALLVFAFYAALGLLILKRFAPRLSPGAKLLAALMFAAQLAVILASIIIRSETDSDFIDWLWYLNGEWNIPAYLASTQLVLVSGVAFATAWLTRGRAAALRLYLVAIGLFFLFLAADEFFLIHEQLRAVNDRWWLVYLAFGAAIALSTIAVAARAPRRTWLWHACLLIGIAIAGIAALALDHFRYIRPCGSIFIFSLDGCLQPHLFEESLEFAGIWLALLGMLGHFSALERPPSPYLRRALLGLPPVFILLLFVSAPYQTIELPSWAAPASVQFEHGVQVYGYSVEDEELNVSIIASLPRDGDDSRLGYSIHLVDQISGSSVAGADANVNRKTKVSRRLHDYRPLYSQVMELELPPDAPTNRALWIVLTLWREQGDDFAGQSVVSSELQLLSDTQIVLGELALPAAAAAPSVPPIARFANGFALETADFPDQAQRGETMDITFAWRSNDDGLADYSQFLHFVHSESGDWWGYDQSPLGARLPTRLWYSGLVDSETWRVPLPADLARGRYAVYTGLYDARDNVRLTATDADGTRWLDNRVALGSLLIE